MVRFPLLFASITAVATTGTRGLSLPPPPPRPPSPPASSSSSRSPPPPPRGEADAKRQNSFVVAQYNVLAGSLGANTHPWFLHGLPDLTDERREAVTARFYRRDGDADNGGDDIGDNDNGDAAGKLLKIGWPDHAEGVLTEEEQRTVERVDRKYFAWDERKGRLLHTIAELDADLLSLVEVDHYGDHWEEEMGRLGYGGIYKQRPRGGCSDGCAIFYRRGVFDLVDHRGVELVDKSGRGGGGGGGNASGRNDADDDRPVSRIGETADRVALLALVRHVPTNRRLIFVSTHLARNPECPRKTKERAQQVAQILYQVTLFAKEHEGEDEEEEAEAPVILAGDLNEANLWHLGTMARIKCGVADMDCHPFIFTSRAASPSISSTPTSITSCRSLRIDYILLQPSLMEVCEQSALEIGEEECRIIIDQDDLIPNERHPSDHVPIAFRVAFRDRLSATEGCAASWAEAVARQKAKQGRSAGSTDRPVRPGGVLRLEEMEEAFLYFDGNRDGVCDRTEVWQGLERLRIDSAEAETILEAVSNGRSSLTLDEFRALYVKSWLRQQRTFLDRVRSVRTMFDLSVKSTNFFSDSGGETGDLFAEMDADGDGIVTMEDVIDHLARVERSEDSLRTRVVDAFSFFDFDSGNDFSMEELHQCFVIACPFEVSTDLVQVAFDDMGKAYNERVELDVFIDWLIRIYFQKDIGWISLVGPIPK